MNRGDVREKGLHDLVTEVDEESQRVIMECLSEALKVYPGRTL